MHRPWHLYAATALFLAVSALAQNVTLSLQVSGKTRNCVVHVPTGINKPALVFFVHGAGGSGAAFESETKGDVTADREKFIAAYPSASANGGSGTWDDMQGTTNFPFFLAVIDTLDARYHIDRNKVYMTGFSQGGMISFVAGCSYSDVFAAVAPVSGHSNTTCTLKRPVPLFMTFGTKDIGATSTFIADLNVWSKLDGCPATPTLTHPYPAANASSGVTRASYGPCSQGSYLVLDSILDEGHQWPDAKRLNQSDEVWAFFKQFTLNSTTGVHSEKSTQARLSFQVTYAEGVVKLIGVGEKSRVRVTDFQGRWVETPKLKNAQFAFTAKPSGVYFVTVTDGRESAEQKFFVP